MNRYKMKPGTTIADIENCANENRWLFNQGGTWISKDSEHFLSIPLCDRDLKDICTDISLEIAFPHDLEKWDDFENILVMDELFGQPFNPFYKHMDHPEEPPYPRLKAVIEKYNEVMDKLPFLERIA